MSAGPQGGAPQSTGGGEHPYVVPQRLTHVQGSAIGVSFGVLAQCCVLYPTVLGQSIQCPNGLADGLKVCVCVCVAITLTWWDRHVDLSSASGHKLWQSLQNRFC